MRMKSGSRLVAGVVAVAFAGTLTGCSSGDESSNANEIRFSWWGSDNRNAKTNAVIDLFEQNTDVVISPEPSDFAKYWERLNVQAASDNMPCVTSILTFTLNDYADNGLLLNLAADDGLDMSGLDADVVDSLKNPDGSLYMMPYGIAPDAIIYNETMAEENGIAIPEESYTWDDYWQWLQTAQESLPAGVYATAPPTDANGALTYLASLGPVFDEDGAPVFEVGDLAGWFVKWKDLIDEGVSLPASQINDYSSSHEDSALAQGVVLSTGVPANAIGANQQGMEAHGVEGTVGYFLRPVSDSGEGTDFLPVNGLSIPASCANQEAATEFVDFWVNNDDAVRAFGADNGSPAIARQREMLLEDPETSESTRTMIEVADRVVNRGHLEVRLPVGYQAGFIDTYNRVSIAAIGGDMDPMEAAQEVYTALETANS